MINNRFNPFASGNLLMFDSRFEHAKHEVLSKYFSYDNNFEAKASEFLENLEINVSSSFSDTIQLYTNMIQLYS